MAPIWILVADSGRARLFRSERPVPPTLLLMGLGLACLVIGALRREADAKAHAAGRFARELAGVLQKGRLGQEYGRLYVLAAPSFLGTLRSALDPVTAGSITHTVAKDVVRQRPESIRRHLPERL